MIKLESCMQTEINNKNYRFSCDPNAPMTEVLEALSHFRFYISGKLHEALENQKVQENVRLENQNVLDDELNEKVINDD